MCCCLTPTLFKLQCPPPPNPQPKLPQTPCLKLHKTYLKGVAVLPKKANSGFLTHQMALKPAKTCRLLRLNTPTKMAALKTGLLWLIIPNGRFLSKPKQASFKQPLNMLTSKDHWWTPKATPFP